MTNSNFDNDNVALQSYQHMNYSKIKEIKALMLIECLHIYIKSLLKLIHSYTEIYIIIVIESILSKI